MESARRPEGTAVQAATSGSLEIRLQARPEFVSVVRRRLRTWLEDKGVGTGDAFEVLLATTEAFTNAVEHPHEPTSHLVDVRGSFADPCVTISIHDYGTWQSEQARKEQGGLGLVIIESLMDDVHVKADMDGTTVTMTRRLTTR